MTRPRLGSCGETDERVAARSHKIIVAFYAAAVAGLAGALAMELVMLAWHRASVKVHERRAEDAGE